MKSEFFTNNRHLLMDALVDGLVVLAGYTGMQWQGDTAVPFRQEANFWYLTGIAHADWRLIIDGRAGTSWLVAPVVDEMHQLFDGSLGADVAKRMSGVDGVISQQEGKALLAKLAKAHNDIYTLHAPPYAQHVAFTLNPAEKQLQRELCEFAGETKDCRPVLARLRAVKLPEEIEYMRQAALVSVEAFEKAKSVLPRATFEYEVEAELTYCFRRHGTVHAFEPIVACGEHACTLHYVQNAGRLERGGLILIDAGASCSGYPADVTRTYAYMEPTERQMAVHRTVQDAEQRIVALVQPGMSIAAYLDSVDNIMKESLLSLGLMKHKKDEKAYRRYFPHAISHGLGLDVHEGLGGYKELRPGMVLTVEPGIYIPEEGIGVRIEDAVVVLEDGQENLTVRLSTDL